VIADVGERSCGGYRPAAQLLSPDDLVASRRISARYDEVVVAVLAAGPVPASANGPESVMTDLAVTLLPVRSAAQFCALWGDLVRR
jgi:hypothetical protein